MNAEETSLLNRDQMTLVLVLLEEVLCQRLEVTVSAFRSKFLEDIGEDPMEEAEFFERFILGGRDL